MDSQEHSSRRHSIGMALACGAACGIGVLLVALGATASIAIFRSPGALLAVAAVLALALFWVKRRGQRATSCCGMHDPDSGEHRGAVPADTVS